MVGEWKKGKAYLTKYRANKTRSKSYTILAEEERERRGEEVEEEEEEEEVEEEACRSIRAYIFHRIGKREKKES